MKFTVYSKPGCVQCNGTYRAMDKKGLDYNKIDVSQDEAALELTKSLGHMQAPVVVKWSENGDIEDHWSGFNPEKIAEYALAVQAA